MLLSLLFFFFFFLLGLVLFFGSMFITEKSEMDFSEDSFECGFDSFSMKNLFFSIRFFVICVIFLIFDVEVTFLLPFCGSSAFSIFSLTDCLIIIFILWVGLLVEWNCSSLSWKY